MTAGRNHWTIQLVRSDGRRSRTLSAARGAILIGIAACFALLLIVGIAIGRGIAAREESVRIADLTRELAVLRSRGGDVAALTERLESIEAAYARLRAAVTEGAEPAATAPRLPTGPGAAAGDGAGPATPAWPLAQRGFVTRTYGSSGDSSGDGHTGLDIAVPSGSYVRATQAGVVEEAGEDEVYGRYVRIAHGDAVSSLYGHNSWLFVQPGDSVERLQVIALSGNTGRSTAPHLHFEIRDNGELIDPLAFVNQGGGSAGRPRQNGVEPR